MLAHAHTCTHMDVCMEGFMDISAATSSSTAGGGAVPLAHVAVWAAITFDPLGAACRQLRRWLGRCTHALTSSPSWELPSNANSRNCPTPRRAIRPPLCFGGRHAAQRPSGVGGVAAQRQRWSARARTPRGPPDPNDGRPARAVGDVRGGVREAEPRLPPGLWHRVQSEAGRP